MEKVHFEGKLRKTSLYKGFGELDPKAVRQPVAGSAPQEPHTLLHRKFLRLRNLSDSKTFHWEKPLSNPNVWIFFSFFLSSEVLVSSITVRAEYWQELRGEWAS